MAIPMEFERLMPRDESGPPLSHANMRSNALWRSVARACVAVAKNDSELVMKLTECDEQDVEQLAKHKSDSVKAKPQDIVRLGLYVPNVSSKHIQQTSAKAYLASNFGEAEFQQAEVSELRTVIQAKHLRLLAGAWMHYHLSVRTEPSHRGKPLEMNGEVIEVVGFGIRSYKHTNSWEKVGIRDWAWDEETQENIFHHERDLVSGSRRAFRLEGWRMNHPWSGGNVGKNTW